MGLDPRHALQQEFLLPGYIDDVVNWLTQRTKALAFGDTGTVALSLAKRGLQTTVVLSSEKQADTLRRIVVAQSIPLRVKVANIWEFDIRGWYDIMILDNCFHQLDCARRSLVIANLKSRTRVKGYHVLTTSAAVSADTGESGANVAADPEPDPAVDYKDWQVVFKSDFTASGASDQALQHRVHRLIAWKRSGSSDFIRMTPEDAVAHAPR
jgi:hypothetical protein